MPPSESPKSMEGRISVRGAVLKAARLRKGLRYGDLSKISLREDIHGNQFPISVTTIKKAEKGGPCYLSTIRALAEALGLEPEDLIAGPAVADDLQARPSPSSPHQMHEAPSTGETAPEPVRGRHQAVEPIRFALNRQAPSVAATVPLFDRRKVEDEFYAPIEQGLVTEFGWRAERARLARFVLRELMNNGFVHGCRGAGEAEVTFSADAERDGENLVLTVRSPGEGFDVARVMRESLERGLGDGGEPHGRGLFFVKSIARELIASSNGRVMQALIERKPEPGNSRGIRPTLLSFDGKHIAVLTLPRIVSTDVFGVGQVFDGERLSQIAAEEATVGGIVDMTQCEQVDSGTLGSFINVRRRFPDHKRRKCVYAVTGEIMELFSNTPLIYVLTSFRSVDECIDYILKD